MKWDLPLHRGAVVQRVDARELPNPPTATRWQAWVPGLEGTGDGPHLVAAFLEQRCLPGHCYTMPWAGQGTASSFTPVGLGIRVDVTCQRATHGVRILLLQKVYGTYWRFYQALERPVLGC